MNIQIFGKTKCFDTKKAERYFKERRIKYQYIDLYKYGMSRGELSSVVSCIGLDSIVDPADQDYELFMHLARKEDKMEKLFEIPEMLRTPIVRNGKQATVGLLPGCLEKLGIIPLILFHKWRISGLVKCFIQDVVIMANHKPILSGSLYEI